MESNRSASNRQMNEILTNLGIAHKFETYKGGHNDQVPARFETRVLPFSSTNLSFAAGRQGREARNLARITRIIYGKRA
jgi:hypothetical protein